jgi:hypothetical protein
MVAAGDGEESQAARPLRPKLTQPGKSLFLSSAARSYGVSKQYRDFDPGGQFGSSAPCQRTWPANRAEAASPAESENAHVMSIDQFMEEYGDLTRDVVYAGYETYETKLQDWFDFIDGAAVSKARIATLEANFDFPTWYAKAQTSVGGMVGSGKVPWARDKTARLGQQLALFRHFANHEFAWSDFTDSFLSAGAHFDDNIRNLNNELFEPFARDLLKDIQRANADASPGDEVPAADRLVSLDHNSTAYRQAMDSLEQVADAVARSNEIGAGEPETRQRVIAELDAGRRLLKATQVRAQLAWAALYPALRWAASQTAGTIIGVAITAAIALLAALMGMTVPGL